jgi:hypothetical protein
MRILVKTCSDKTIEVFVENLKMSVMGFKRLIAEKETIPPQHQRLLFATEELDNSKTLEEVVNTRPKPKVEEAEFETEDEELVFHLIPSVPPRTEESITPSSLTPPASETGKRKRPSDESSSASASPKASPARKLSKKCAFVGCSKRSVVIIGDCKFCNEKFCSSHRLVEDHKCTATASCRQASFDKNASKLLREKCVAQKLRQY